LIDHDAVPEQPQCIVDCKGREEVHVQSGPRTPQGPAQVETQESLYEVAKSFTFRLVTCHHKDQHK
jgi:hypothetical protein